MSLAGSGAWEQHSGKTGDVCVGWDDRVGKQTVSYAGSGTAMTVEDSPAGAQPKGGAR